MGQVAIFWPLPAPADVGSGVSASCHQLDADVLTSLSSLIVECHYKIPGGGVAWPKWHQAGLCCTLPGVVTRFVGKLIAFLNGLALMWIPPTMATCVCGFYGRVTKGH